jgi:histidine triad (HIT) family protein
MPKYDLAAHVESSRKGPCFVCAYLAGYPDYKHEPVYGDDHAVAFLSRYPTLRGYTIVAPRSHIVDVTGDEEDGRLVDFLWVVAQKLSPCAS